MTDYVCGFAFNESMSKVVMIRKNRPEWQAGKWNGVGGHIEPGEYALDAMVREFKEEAGIETGLEDWREFATLTGYNLDTLNLPVFRVHFFSTILSPHQFASARSMTDEQVTRMMVGGIMLGSFLVLPNIRMLIALALDQSGLTQPVALSMHS